MTTHDITLPLPGKYYPSPAREASFHLPFGSALRVFTDRHPGTKGHPAQPGLWPAQWISVAPAVTPHVAAYKLEFSLTDATRIRIHLTADERYEFFVDGHSIASGPERGDWENWFFESYDLDLTPGPHTFVARVWSLGEKAPFAQFTLQHGFFLCPDESALVKKFATGIAPWQGKILTGYDWRPPASCAWGTGWNQVTDGKTYCWGHEKGQGDDWENVVSGPYGDSAEAVRNITLQKSSAPHHRLRPGMIPPMIREKSPVAQVLHVSPISGDAVGLIPIKSIDSLPDEMSLWGDLIAGVRSLTIPVHTARRIILDLGDYFCGRPILVLSGGHDASIEVDWAESLYEDITIPEDCECIEGYTWPKGDRSKIEGKYFVCPWTRQNGSGDIFHMDGGSHRTFSTLWWQAGRYLQVLVRTAASPLQIESLAISETRYPLEAEGSFDCSDQRLNSLIPIMTRTMQMCAHETYMDSPFYEQLMYAGDTRLEMLVTYVMTPDDRLPQKALKLFDWSRLLSGLTQSRYPARVRQVIPPFSLWWISSCHDYALWRGQRDFLAELLPGIRAVCDHFGSLVGEEGLLKSPSGWNFTDWVPDWQPNGVPPDAESGISGLLNWQAAMTFRQAAELEEWFGEPEIALLQRRRAHTIATASHTHFWNRDRQLYADDLAHQHWSEHTQCLALLSELMPASCIQPFGEQLFTRSDLTRTTVYFRHYLFEACHKLGRIDAFFSRLDGWTAMLDIGLKTTLEQPEPSRSDCHAWSAHPLFHLYATVAGLRPTKPGFTELEVSPQLGELDWLSLTMPHPEGQIVLDITGSSGTIEAPAGVSIKSVFPLQRI